MRGHTVKIIDSKFSCVPVGTVGTVSDNHPLIKGLFVQVDTVHTALFGGATVKGSGKYFFEYHEVEPYLNGAKSTGHNSAAGAIPIKPLVNESI